ncbi:H/ACA ribonucleoprotein complex non-core subunit NAF1 [Zancudomyces culisetae]|uniref:H/ACA ribonucleoprotein complex subunit n=1 Tax=Zancudomyces culisetae TaxID=1213189 RepID=A0A1R1PZC5_ZANCU|nr:H/ACA ribonucleoprotein complex non-core subunit NAF1 [Zancudomyces culisetae]|eukprot:OMH86296.1 H/ACA ribonucleoprotein complex non-core subunit NAF1 [Zancudomyces culisetae]
MEIDNMNDEQRVFSNTNEINVIEGGNNEVKMEMKTEEMDTEIQCEGIKAEGVAKSSEDESSDWLDSSSESEGMSEDEDVQNKSTTGDSLNRKIGRGKGAAGDVGAGQWDDDNDEEMAEGWIPATKNEITQPKAPEVDFTEIPKDTKVVYVGTIHTVVDNTVVVKGNISGEYRVMDYGSLLVLEDYRVLGLVSVVCKELSVLEK